MNGKKMVYAIQHNVTKRMYIGSSREPETRCNAHLYSLRNGNHPVELMQSDYDNHGENYSFFLLDEITDYFEKAKEREWMCKYKTYDKNYGYNYNDPMFSRRKNREIAFRTDKPTLPEETICQKKELLEFVLGLDDEDVDKILNHFANVTEE